MKTNRSAYAAQQEIIKGINNRFTRKPVTRSINMLETALWILVGIMTVPAGYGIYLQWIATH